MRREMEHRAIAVTDGWIRCPACRRNKKLLKVQPDTSAEYLVVFCRICKKTMILNIEPGQHCSSAVGIPQALAMKIFRSWKGQVQRVVGRPFKFIKIIDYGPHPIPGIVFYVIADLPEGVCQETCGSWYMGKAVATPLDSSGFNKVADSIMRQDSNTAGTYSHLWSYCAKNLQFDAVSLPQ